LHGGVQQLAFPASPVWFEAPFEDHLSTGKDTVAKRSLRAKITNVQWNVERWFNPYLVVASLPSQPFTERNLPLGGLLESLRMIVSAEISIKFTDEPWNESSQTANCWPP
jgi:hypothetical protein